MNASWFFPLSKLAWFLLAPSQLLLWLALATAALLLLRRERAARWCAITTGALFVVFGVLPVGQWLAQPLEDEYPRPAALAKVDGILTLGGGLNDRILQQRGAPAAERAETRLVSAFELARRFPSARVVFSGGWGPFADAKAAQYALAQMGLDPARLVIENRSRNTFENLQFSQRLVNPQPGETWVLATSALQMPRAMAEARRLGWALVPWPTDYVTPARATPADVLAGFNVAGRLELADAAAHEWLGLLAYRLASGGRSRSPAPPSSRGA